MLYDYATNNLDDERKSSVEDFLRKSEESQKILEDIYFALEYCKILSTTKISEPFCEDIKESKEGWAKYREQFAWSQWPEFLKWGFEALAVSLIVAAVSIILPWDILQEWLPSEKMNPKQVVVSKKKKATKTIVDKQEPKKATSTEEDKTETTLNKAKVEVAAKKLTKVQPKAKETKKEKPKRTTVVKKEKKIITKGEAKGTFKGEVYRAFMKLSDIDEVTPGIVAKIETLGGGKAGRVRLGWRKK